MFVRDSGRHPEPSERAVRSEWHSWVVALANDAEALVWRRTGLTWWMAGCWTMFVLLSLATLTAGIGIAFYACLLVAATFLLVRTLTSRVVITSENLLIRSPFRTGLLSWDSIVEARSVLGRNRWSRSSGYSR